MEDILPGKQMSGRMRQQIDKRRIYRNTALKLHPNPCLCKTHLARSHPPPTSVSNLRSKFEATERIDPRTGMPPEPDKSNEDSPSNTIPVHTSR